MEASTAAAKWPVRTIVALVLLAASGRSFAQSPAAEPASSWHSSEARQIATEAPRYLSPPLRIEPDRIYSLAELIDLAESYNPETRAEWENIRAQAAALGIARSELFPTVAAVALAGVDRDEVALGAQFIRPDCPGF
jgi:outer membrane protein TolC